jgi:hypothetical protein
LRKATGQSWGPVLWLLLGLLLAFATGMVLGGAPGIPFLALGAAGFLFTRRRRGSRVAASREDA